MLQRCGREERWATALEQAVLARWSGWGAVPQVFGDADEATVAQLRRLLGSEEAWAQARRTTLNAHYTSAVVVQAMWRTVEALGFDGGRVLEPGCGSGNFIGFAPDTAEVVGVELDATTAAIAEHLYGARARIHVGGFEDFAAPDGSFDLVIGNVPFGKIAPYDPRHNRGNHTLHNYFLLKSLALTRPGGLVVTLTSRYTLDARNPAARRYLARYGDLVGAVRLPERAFARSSGTDVVTDLVVLRRRAPGEQLDCPSWTAAVPVDLDDVASKGAGADSSSEPPVVINEYLAHRGDMVLGRVALSRGMYRDRELTVEPTGDLGERLDAALERLVADADARGATLSPSSMAPEHTAVHHPASGEFDTRYAQEGSLVTARSGEVGRYVGGQVVAYRPLHSKDFWELRRLIGLRDAARHVLATQLARESSDEVAAAQAELTDRYERYRRYYGPINRFRRSRSGASLAPRMGGFRRLDPDWPLVAALEIFDDETQTAEAAPIFTQRVIEPPAQRTRAENGTDAVAVCLDESGMVTVERVAELLGVTEDRARTEIDALVFEDPHNGALIPATEYLSGNIRHKLTAAHAAAERYGERWQANIEALEAVMPPQRAPGEISARLGAPWIPAADIEAFCAEVLDADVGVEYLADIGRWQLKRGLGFDRDSLAVTSEWGTARANAITLLDASLSQRLHTVYDYVDAGAVRRRVRNDAETLAARDKQEALGERFSRWVWDEPHRAQRLAGTYNELFCSVALRHYDGSHLSLPGLAPTFTPHRHQRDAVARILSDGRTLLAHAVGAGKTATMVMAAMELRRLGSASKPAVIVPNHMLEQFSREWLQLYPTARILIADSGQLDQTRRKEFVARCALGDWDGIVFTHSGFEQIPLGRDLFAEYLGAEVDAARRAIEVAKKGKRSSVKQLEKLLAQAEERLKKLLDAAGKDDGVRWEETGIDYLCVDEAHLFKNRRIITSVDGVASQGSKRAQDLDAKLWALRRRHGPRTVTFATATPVANTIAELWVMQSYLQPDVLEDAAVRIFDTWAATFGRTRTALELAPDGASYRMHTRFARFHNLRELMGLYLQVADCQTAEDLALPTPNIVGGKPETVVVAGSENLERYVAELAARAKAVHAKRVRPDEDNMLSITGDGRRAALDLRLVGQDPDPDGGKIAAAARRITDIYHATRDSPYLDSQGEPSTRAGALQLVFCDVSTPAAAGWNAYDGLRHELARRGVPAETVRFMQEARTDQGKAKLFAACRDGQVAQLLGSTETMGVGTNVQARAIALHHLDAPWRPCDIEQRDGRIRRQGNQNASVEIIRYVTEGSFDAYIWQAIERKATSFAPILAGRLDIAEIDEIDEHVLSAAEAKALATGDPRIMEKAGVDADIARLARLERSHHDEQRHLRELLDQARRRVEDATERADRLAEITEDVSDTRGDRFRMNVGGDSPRASWHTKRIDAGTHLRDVLVERLTATPPETTIDHPNIAELADLAIAAQTTTVIEDEVRIAVPDADIELRYVGHELRNADPAALIARLERRIQRLPTTIESLRQTATGAAGEASRAAAQLAKPWEHADELRRLRRRQAELDEMLTEADTPEPAPSAEQAEVAAPTPKPPPTVAVPAEPPGLD